MNALSDQDVDRIALRVVELIRSGLSSEEFVDATEIARRFHVDRSWVYEHADELGAIRLGSGPKARLRFDPAKVFDALASAPFDPSLAPRRQRPRRSRSAPATELLPVGRGR